MDSSGMHSRILHFPDEVGRVPVCGLPHAGQAEQPTEAARIAHKYDVSGSKQTDGRMALVCC